MTPLGGRALPSFPLVCLITDRHLVEPRDLIALVVAAVAGGVNLVQLREKDLPTRQLLQMAIELQSALRNRAALVVNSRADVAFAAVADGVHLPADGLTPVGARAVLGGDAIVGQSVHSAAEALHYAVGGLDYVELGTVFPSRSHPEGSVVGLDAVRAAARGPLPVLAVGGIGPENAGAVIEAGAAGVAVISSILADSEPQRAAARLREAVEAAWAQTDDLRASPSGRGRAPA